MVGEQYIRDRLQEVVRLKRGIWVTRAAATLAGYGAVIAACHFLLDWSFRPGVGPRLFLLACFLGALGYAVRLEVWLPWRRFPTRDESALEVERHFPQLDGRFVSSYQLSRASGGGSPGLIARLVEETAGVARTLDFRSVPDRRGRNRGAAAAGAVLLAWVVFLGLSTMGRESFSVWLARLFNPFSGMPYPTKTRVVVEEGNRVVARGDDVELRARAAGVVPASGSIRIRRGGQSWMEQPVLGSGREFVFVQKAAVESFAYRWKLGDGESQIYRVEVIIPPQVRGIAVRYDYPAYTQRAAETAMGGNLEALPGTQATLRIRTNKPIREGTLILEGGPQLNLTREGESTYTVALNIMERGSYRVRLVDEYGFENRDPMEYAIQPLADEVPRIELGNVEEHKFVTRYAALPVELLCRDDYGITSVRVHLSVAGAAENSVDVPIRGNQRQITVEHTVRLEDWEIEPGTEVLFWASATDNRALGGPQRGFSKKVRLEVVTPEELISLLRNRMESLFPRIEQIAEDTLESKTSVQDIVGDGGASDGPTTGTMD